MRLGRIILMSLLWISPVNPAIAGELDLLTQDLMSACLSFVIENDTSVLNDKWNMTEYSREELEFAENNPGYPLYELTYAHPVYSVVATTSHGTVYERSCSISSNLTEGMPAPEAVSPNVQSEWRPTSPKIVREAILRWVAEHAAGYDFVSWPDALEKEIFLAFKPDPFMFYRRCTDQSFTILIAKEGILGKGELDMPYWSVEISNRLSDRADQADDYKFGCLDP